MKTTKTDIYYRSFAKLYFNNLNKATRHFTTERELGKQIITRHFMRKQQLEKPI